MLYFLKQTFNMHESHIHSFLSHFPFICYNKHLLIDTDFLCKRFYYVTPSYVEVVQRNGRNNKIRTVLGNWKRDFEPEKDNFDCIEVSIHTVHRQLTKLQLLSF